MTLTVPPGFETLRFDAIAGTGNAENGCFNSCFLADFMLDMVDFHQEHMDKVISTKKIYGLLVYPLVNN